MHAIKFQPLLKLYYQNISMKEIVLFPKRNLEDKIFSTFNFWKNTEKTQGIN